MASSINSLLRTALQDLEAVEDLIPIIQMFFNKLRPILEKGMDAVERNALKTYSDIIPLIDQFNDGQESLYETAVRICNFYKSNKHNKPDPIFATGLMCRKCGGKHFDFECPKK